MTFKEFCKELLEEYRYIIFQYIAGINNIARIKKYGDIKEIKRA